MLLYFLPFFSGLFSADSCKISLFTVCFHSHLRGMLSIARELSTRPNTQVTLIVLKSCEDLVLQQGLNIEVEAVSSEADDWEGPLEIDTITTYLYLLEQPILAHYAQAWKEMPEKRPDVLMSDPMMHAGIDLGEIFGIPHVFLFSVMDAYSIVVDNALENEYVTFVTPIFTFRPSDFGLVRAVTYAAKRLIGTLANRHLTVRRNELRNEYGLKPVTTVFGNGLDSPSFVFFESFYGFDEARLAPPYIQYVGPLRFKELSKSNDPETEKWIENCKGFIYVSTGSIDEITEYQAQVFKQVFESIPYSFLVSSKSFSTTLENVKVVDWVNQPEIMQNPKLLAFISHGGFMSIMEAIEFLVPVVCLPAGKDHFFICDRVHTIGIGKAIFPGELNAESLSEAIKKVIGDEKYRVDLLKTRIIMEMHQGERVIADAIIRFSEVGYQHLIPKWYSMPWYQRNELDIFAVYLIIVLFLTRGILNIFRKYL